MRIVGFKLRDIKNKSPFLTNLWKTLLDLKIAVQLSKLYRPLGVLHFAHKYRKRGFCPPAPSSFKQAVLGRYGKKGEIWIESGTLRGETARFLSRIGSDVITIEPSKSLAAISSRRLKKLKNVKVVHAKSEDVLASLLKEITGHVNFWLDGHYSGGETFRGPLDTPIVEELKIIEAALKNLTSIVICIDDMRCFEPQEQEYSSYPNRTNLVEFAERNQLGWTIEHDIFICWSR